MHDRLVVEQGKQVASYGDGLRKEVRDREYDGIRKGEVDYRCRGRSFVLNLISPTFLAIFFALFALEKIPT